MSYGKEEQIELALIKRNNRGEYIKVTRIIPEGNRMESVDIRTMYTDEADEIRPTKKGVRISSESLPELVTALVQSLSTEEAEEIMELIKEKVK